jgi:hypothetical protein
VASRNQNIHLCRLYTSLAETRRQVDDAHRPVKFGSNFSKRATALGLAIVAMVCAFAWFSHSMMSGFLREASVGAELPPAEHEGGLAARLQERFSWSALPPASVEHVWANGFPEHTWLYRIHLAPDIFADLRQSVLAAQGDGITSDDRDDLGLCPFGFATTSPEGPDEVRVPAWWEAASLRHYDSILWQSAHWGCWLAYDTDRQLLFLLTYNE